MNVDYFYFRFADEVNGEIPEVDTRGRIKRFVCKINLSIFSNFRFHCSLLRLIENYYAKVGKLPAFIKTNRAWKNPQDYM